MRYLIALIVLVSLSYGADEFTMKTGKYELQTDFIGNETVTVSYAVPMKDGRVLPSYASNIVFCAPYVGEKVFFKRDFNNYFVKKLGCTVFSFEFKYKNLDVGNRKKWYYYKESGWHDLVFRIQTKLVFDYGLERRKIIVVGESGGASMGQQMGLYYPDKIEAVAGIGGGCYDEIKTASDVSWFMINTWGDSTTQINDEFAASAKKLGVQVLRLATPPDWSKKEDDNFRHIPSKTAEEFVFDFVEGIVDLRKENKGRVPSVKDWPAKVEVAKENTFFPSEEFKKKWAEYPRDMIKKVANPDGTEDIVEFSAKDSKKIILCLQDKKVSAVMLLDNMYYLYKQGYDIVSIDLSMDIYEDCKKRIKKALDYSIERSKKENKELVVLGFWESGLTLYNEVAKTKEGDVKKCLIFNPEKNYFSEKTTSFPAGTVCQLYYTKEYWDDKPIGESAWCKEMPFPRKNDLGSEWFKDLKKAVSGEETKDN